MPIDKKFRERWTRTDEHRGHSVWVSSDSSTCIHGDTVGVDLISCNGCMKCIPACPTRVFSAWVSSTHGSVADPVRDADCTLCLVCEVVCPTSAIHIERSSGSSDTLDSLLRGA